MKNEVTLHPSFPRRRESSLIEQAWLGLANQRLNVIIENKRVETTLWEEVRIRIDLLVKKQRLSK